MRESRQKRDDKLTAMLVQQRVESLKDWVDQYVANMGNGLRALETDLTDLSKTERSNLYNALGADRFEEKYRGDKLAALRRAIL